VARRGQTEVLLLESLALEVSEAIFAANRVPGAVVEVLLKLYGVERDLGAPPTATFRFNVGGTAGYEIPMGTRVSLILGGGLDPVVFTTDAVLAVPPGSTFGTVTATGDRNTADANGAIPGTTVELLDSVSSVDSVALSTTVSGGSAAEEDIDWFTRGVQRFSRLAETLVLPRHFVAAALENTFVTRAFAIDNYNGTTSTTSPGNVTVAVYGLGANVSAGNKALLDADFESRAQANLAVHVVDPTITDVNVTASVEGTPGYSVAQVQANVTAALTAYLSPEQWSWAGTVYRNELIALLDRVEGVERVNSITAPSADVTLTGVAPLARLGTATITVTGL
jgi:uncharacterized phage protein gp47/JayE